MSVQVRNLQGNEACALGAIAAGCRFYAGYPITPSSEIAERMAEALPKVGGAFVQMEDEIASIAAVLGAEVGGTKAMTATSGPGFSLKQEVLGFAAAAEIPCVVVNVMRGGPSTGMPTRPSQGDMMQARWGTHGDHPVIALAPASVSEVYTQTARAFNLSERFRIPAVVLYDEVIGHLQETVDLRESATLELAERKWARGSPATHLPYAETDDGVPVMSRPGDGHRDHMTGLTHGEDGFPTQNPEAVTRAMDRLLGKLERDRDAIDAVDMLACEDADIVVVACGIVARAARRAVRDLRAEGLAAGLFRPITLWPFPEQAFARAAEAAKIVLVAEMNAGQLRLEVERLCPPGARVVGLGRIDGTPIAPAEIRAKVQELTQDA
ncbi:MAG: 2-oxoacid:acceptor oxidoreductase subunit alpha [Alphaproteobacteria bacterium]|jgi:2-oxoglutarate ferredoxin oxidoreductase subunit alpha|nr:2-oxoacid:acceptor oxidoreductase subunit alpha [Alphaproteobacteria bacterium]MDP6515276.1 2-oxoacid:acceptor oxidoreductase subunit alpha [Alphaproteobacteria bacterium]